MVDQQPLDGVNLQIAFEKTNNAEYALAVLLLTKIPGKAASFMSAAEMSDADFGDAAKALQEAVEDIDPEDREAIVFKQAVSGRAEFSMHTKNPQAFVRALGEQGILYGVDETMIMNAPTLDDL